MRKDAPGALPLMPTNGPERMARQAQQVGV